MAVLLAVLLWATAYGFAPPGLAPRRLHLGPPATTTTTLIHQSTIPWPHRSQPPPPLEHKQRVRKTISSIRHYISSVSEVTRWRVAAVSFIGSSIACRPVLDRHLACLWTYLTTSSSWAARIFRTDSYEWCLAILAFSVYIHAFGWADRVVRRAVEQGRTHPWRKFRLQDRFIADQHRRSISENASGSTGSRVGIHGVVDNGAVAMPAVSHSPWHWGAWMFELLVYAVPLLTWDILSPRRHRRLAAFGPPTTLRIMRDVTAGLLLYDALFFCGHVLMHKVPLFYRSVHAKHHTTPEVRACDIVRLSLPEEVLEVGFSIVALNVLGAHPVSRTLYNLIIVFLLTELHSGFDFPWTPQNVVPFGLATGSRRHHYHHRFGHHYYQKFFFTWDRLFGTFQPNDGTLKGDSVQRDSYIPASWRTSRASK
jgi:sterol desaturase/sphingolipid hydroxylase (fatty acid hydroxylase superfamily)